METTTAAQVKERKSRKQQEADRLRGIHPYSWLGLKTWWMSNRQVLKEFGEKKEKKKRSRA